eukprot:scaffold1210_cov214-Skeletonema_marinoi.AAC.3
MLFTTAIKNNFALRLAYHQQQQHRRHNHHCSTSPYGSLLFGGDDCCYIELFFTTANDCYFQTLFHRHNIMTFALRLALERMIMSYG